MESLAERLQALDSCAVSDALDSLGLPGAVPGLVRQTSMRRIAGPVRTVKLAAGKPPGGSKQHLGTQAIEAAAPGDVIVVEQATGEADEMRVLAEQGRVRAVGKTLPFPRAALRSLGLVACPDADGGSYRVALEQVIGADDGHLSFHHSIVDLLARTTTVTPIVMEARDWQEIDRPEDIARWEGRDLGDVV